MSLQFSDVKFPHFSVHHKLLNRFIFRRVIQNIGEGAFWLFGTQCRKRRRIHSVRAVRNSQQVESETIHSLHVYSQCGF